MSPCHEGFEKPILEKCPDRTRSSSRRDTPPSMLTQKLVTPPCEWQKSEDGTACETVQSPCDEARSEKPPLHGCPLRAATSSRGAEPPKLLSQKKLMPTCEWQLSEDGSSCDVVQSPCDEAKTEKPPLKGCPARQRASSRRAEEPKALSQ